MNRNQRKYGRVPKRSDSEAAFRPFKCKHGTDTEEVLPPRMPPNPKEKKMLDRCCCVTPDRRSIGQLTEAAYFPDMHYENLIAQQYGSIIPDFATIAQLQELRKVLCCSSQPKTENASQYSITRFESLDSYQKSVDNAVQWQNVNSTDEVDKIMLTKRDEETLTQYHSLPKNFHISELPTVKIIAVKFKKYKKNNIELRKLEEKVVCVEYNVFDMEKDAFTPVQKMRAFFSMKPNNEDKEANALAELPSTIKNRFNISSGDLRKLNQKEIEIIDGKILENQPYLEDLRKVLRQRQVSPKKSTKTLNLHSLYDMARRELLECATDFDAKKFSNAEMLEVQNLILENCKSSVHGIRRTVDNSSKFDIGVSENTLSQSLLTALLRADGLQ